MKASIIILDYKKAEKVVENVASIFRQKCSFDYEIIVVDNSEDVVNAEILRKIKDVKLMINKKNNGYTKGNNQGARISSGEFIFIVNPDIVWSDENTLQKMVEYMEKNPDVAVLAPAQKNPDGSRPLTVRDWPKISNQIFRRTFLRKLPVIKDQVAQDEMQDFDYSRTQGVPWLQSSFFAVRRGFWEEASGFDEDYFIFMADTEMCWQAHERKKRVVYYPEVTVQADGLRCSEGKFTDIFKKSILRQHLKDSLIYRKKHS